MCVQNECLNILFMKKTLGLILFLFGTAATVPAQHISNPAPGQYMVVIGAFANPDNATRFVNTSKQYRAGAKSELNKARGLFYVYVLETDDRELALREAARLRAETPMTDTWVHHGALAGEPEKAALPEPLVAPTPQPPPPAMAPPAEPAPVAVATAPVAPAEKTNEEKIKEAVESKPMKMIKGEVERLDYIYFYRDASVLRPESRFEVDRLVQLLKANPEEKIIIHGHTNGNARGPIIRLPDGSKDFFSLENTVEDFGSAQKLSELRALAIYDYLAANGIDNTRMSVKAWGGKKPLYAVDSEQAEANVRVEIEVVD